MKNLTPEMIEKAKAAKTAEELLAVAKANNIDMTADEAATYFAQLNPKSGELGDDELDAVAGGACSSSDSSSNGTIVNVINGAKCPGCGGTTGSIFLGSQGVYDRITCTNCGQIIILAKTITPGVDFVLA